MSMYGVEYSPLEPGDGRGAKQSMKDECDVNQIVARFHKTGLIAHLAQGIPAFVDVSELGDYRSIIDQVRLVEDYFSGLPSGVRTLFDNDASAFMDYLESGASSEDLEKLGLSAVFDRRARRERKRRAEDVDAGLEAPVVPPVAPEEPDTVPT